LYSLTTIASQENNLASQWVFNEITLGKIIA